MGQAFEDTYDRFFDAVLFTDKSRVSEIFGELKRRKLKIEWSCRSRVDVVNKEILKEAGHKVNVALDQERRSGDPEISEVLAVNGGEEYISVMEFILYEKKFGGTNDPEMARFRILKGGRLDDEEVGYFYMPFQEFRAFKGTRLERALREYKKRQASSKK